MKLLIQLHAELKYTMVGDMIGLTENMTMKQDTQISDLKEITYNYVTVHDKTDHIAQKMILELRVPWLSMIFELPMVQVLSSKTL